MTTRILSLLAAVVVALAVNSGAHADLSISKKPTQNMDCQAGVCTPTAKNANLNVSELTAMLASSDTTLQTGNGDGTTPSIVVINGFS